LIKAATDAAGNALITATLGIPARIKAALLGAYKVYLAEVFAKAGNNPAFSTAAFKIENSLLSSSDARVGDTACCGNAMGSGSSGALLHAEKIRQLETTNKLILFIVVNIFISIDFKIMINFTANCNRN
jgi:hypothetical protein